MVEIDTNPYEAVDWDTVEHHWSVNHAHVKNHPGGDPSSVIDDYYDLGFTVYAFGQPAGHDPTWPWTELTDNGYDEDRDPEQMGVVSYPAVEHERTEHIMSHFTTIDGQHYGDPDTREEQIQEIVDRDDLYEPFGMIWLAHPGRYYTNPRTEWDRYIGDFENFSMEDGMMGVAAFNKNSSRGKADRILWDRLLTEFAPERVIWGYAEDDPYSYDMGIDFFRRFQTVLLHPDEFDPSDQSQSRQNAADAYENGRFMIHRRSEWYTGDADDAPSIPKVTDIDVDEAKMEITITAEDYDKIEWISAGGIVGQDETIQLEDTHYPYVRAHLYNQSNSAETSTQPWGLTADDKVMSLGETNAGDIDIGGN